MTDKRAWISPEEAARLLDVSVDLIRRKIDQKKFEATKIGYRTIRINKASFEKYLETNRIS